MIFRKKQPVIPVYQLTRLHRQLDKAIIENQVDYYTPKRSLFVVYMQPITRLFRVTRLQTVSGASSDDGVMTMPHVTFAEEPDVNEDELRPSIVTRLKSLFSRHKTEDEVLATDETPAPKRLRVMFQNIKAQINEFRQRRLESRAEKAEQKKQMMEELAETVEPIVEPEPQLNQKKSDDSVSKVAILPAINRAIDRFVASLESIGPAIKKEKQKYGILAGMVAIVIAMQVSLYYNVTFGVYVVAAAIVVLSAIAISSAKMRNLAISITVLPVTTLLVICLPQEDYFVQTVIYYSVLLVLTLIYRYLFTLDTPKHLTSVGKSWRYVLLVPAMIVAGQFFGVFEYFALRTHFPFDSTPILLVTLSFAVFAIVEEMYYRGLVQASAIREVGATQSIIMATLIFGFGFLGHATFWSLILGLVLGLFLSIVYSRRQNIVLTIMTNMTAKLLFLGLLVTFR